MWPPAMFGLGRGLTFTANSVAIKLARDHSCRMVLALVASLSPPSTPPPSGSLPRRPSLMQVISVINSALRTALYVKLTPPLVAGANIQYTKETKAKKAPKS